MIAAIYDTVGIIGDILIIGAYFLLQLGKVSAKGFPYLFLNLLGALFLLFSLIFAWNLAAFIIEISWALISIYGIWSVIKSQRF
ncbi:MAG: hypothetical protein PVI75_01690 [Gammaproteobacteria bacterium]|jgi:hypothetical protein